MVMKKTLMLSLFLGFMAMGYINVSGTGDIIAMSMSHASIETSFGEPGQGIVSFAIGNFMVYIIVVLVMYLILRSMFKSFGR